MPNWCSNTLYIQAKTDKDAEILISAFKGKDDDGKETCFSFNSIIPRPSSLDITSGSITNMAERYLSEIKEAKSPSDLKELEIKWQKEAENLSTDFGEGYEAFLKYADVVSKNIEEHLHPSWYEWNCANWGTKWDASHTKLTREGNLLTFDFFTPWGPAYEVLIHIAEHFNSHINSMELEYAVEDDEEITTHKFI